MDEAFNLKDAQCIQGCYTTDEHQCHHKNVVFLLVSDSPKELIPESGKMVFAAAGHSLNISATILAYPKPSSVHWRKIADPSITLESHITDLGEDEFLISGTVKLVTLKHYGIYECVVENAMGNFLKAKFDVKLEGKYSCPSN